MATDAIPKRFSLRFALAITAVIAVVVAIAVPAYRRSASPPLTDVRTVIRKSNTILPVVAMQVFASGPNLDRGRILILHRRTETTDGEWEPKWLETGHKGGITCRINGERIYPPDDSKLTVIFASDDDAPTTIRVPYERYADLPWDDTELLWKRLVEGNGKDGR